LIRPRLAGFEVTGDSKRGGRLGWSGEHSEKTFHKFIAHTKEPGVIYWREAVADEIGQIGRPKNFDADEILELLPPPGLTAGEWQQAAYKECGVKESSFHRHRRKLAEQNRAFKSKVTGKWQPIQKPCGAKSVKSAKTGF